MHIYLLIAIGGALGSVARFVVGNWAIAHWGGGFPWGTLLVNVLGSFAIGFVAAFTSEDGRGLSGSAGRQFLMTGVLGGFTTFSAFTLQTLALARDGEWLKAGGNVLGSVALSLVAVWLGYLAGSAVARR